MLPNPNNITPVEDTEIQPAVEPLSGGKMNIDNYRAPRLSLAPQGMIAAGNIDINHRPVVRNADGSTSTEYSTSYQDENGNEVLIPTVIDGRFFTPDGKKPPIGSAAEKKMIQAAIAYHRSDPNHPHLGVFDSVENANAYAEALHSTPRDPKAAPTYVAPTLHPKAGSVPVLTSETHDIVAMPTGHTIAIPSELPSALKDVIATDIHRILSNPPKSGE